MDEQITKEQKKLDDIRKKQEDALNAINIDQSVHDNLKKDILEKENIIVIKENKILDLEEKLNVLDLAKKNKLSEIENITKDHEKLTSEINALKDKKKELESEYTRQIEINTQVLKQKTSEFEEFTNKTNSKKQTIENDINDKTSVLNKITFEIVETDNNLKIKKNQLNNISTDLKELEERLTVYNKLIDTFENKEKTIQSEIIELESKKEFLLQNQISLDEQITSKQKDLDNIKKQISLENNELLLVTKKRFILSEKEEKLRRLKDVIKERYDFAGVEFPDIEI